MLYSSFVPVALYLIDERSKWGSFAAGLPGKWSGYIHAKYIAGIASLIIVLTLSIVCCLAGVSLTGQNEADEQISAFLLGFGAALLMCSAFLPAVTLFGAKMGVVLYFVLITLCGAVAGYMEAMIEDGELAVPDYNFSLPVVGIAVILYLLSWLISVLIYQHKEL